MFEVGEDKDLPFDYITWRWCRRRQCIQIGHLSYNSKMVVTVSTPRPACGFS